MESITGYEQLKIVESGHTHDVYVKEISTGKQGAAIIWNEGARIYYNDADGGDKIVSADEFNENYAIIMVRKKPKSNMPKLTPYLLLSIAERKGAHTIEVECLDTGEIGVAEICKKGVRVFYGADDGSDDCVISADEFNLDFKVLAIIKG